MTIYRSSGKNTEVYEEYELYTKEYVENVGGKSNFAAKGGTTIGENPKTAKPLEIRNLYVKVRLAGEYKGEFGFDWVDVNPDTLEIEKIQDVPYDNVEYFYKEDPNGLGNIVKKSADEMGAKHAIQRHYEFSPISKFIDIPYVLLMPTKKAVLSAEIILWQGAINEDVVAITGDEFYEFTIIGGEKEGKTAKKKVTAAEKIKFEVECLKSGAIDKTYEFKHSNPITGSPAAVGGVRMMENKVLKLKFRVIALVSSDGSPSTKAKALFQKFNDKGIADYLNKNSLNQAGYEVEIENQEMFTNLDTADVDDYLFAFDKADWTSKNYYSIEEREKPKLDSNGYRTGEMAKYNAETVFEDVKIDTGKKDKDNKPIINTLSIDYITIDEYTKKLKIKNKGYSGGVIILVDGECKEIDTGAFSRTSPLDHYSLTIYSKNIERSEDYAHEIGHMLGLSHSFYKEKEVDSFNNSKKYYNDLKNRLQEIKDSNLPSYYYTTQKCKKATLISGLEKYNTKFKNYITEKKELISRAKTSNGTFTYDGKNITKVEFISLSQKEITEKTGFIENNKKAIFDANTMIKRDFLDEFVVPYKFYLLKNDVLILNSEFIKFYETEWNQIINNYVRFKQSSTLNVMDYYVEGIRYLSHQIKIMRGDYQNYLN